MKRSFLILISVLASAAYANECSVKQAGNVALEHFRSSDRQIYIGETGSYRESILQPFGRKRYVVEIVIAPEGDQQIHQWTAEVDTDNCKVIPGNELKTRSYQEVTQYNVTALNRERCLPSDAIKAATERLKKFKHVGRIYAQRSLSQDSHGSYLIRMIYFDKDTGDGVRTVAEVSEKDCLASSVFNHNRQLIMDRAQ
jgi:hypothetical protein